MEKTAAVIGAGIGGIASAIRLSNLGFDVIVFESRDAPGGKIFQFEKEKFRFDTGPSLFTLPSLVNDLFKLHHKNPEEYFSYKALPIITKYFYEDGTVINAHSEPDKFAREVERKTTDTASNVRSYLSDAQQIYELTANNFIFRPFEFSTVFTRDFWKAALNIHKLNIGQTMHQVNRSYFQDDKSIQLFDRYATYLGSDPYQTPGTLAVIPHLEHNIGAFFPENGMYDIIRSLYQLACEIGVEFRFSEPVTQIDLVGDAVRGLVTPQHSYTFDLTVSDVDIFNLYDELLPGYKIPPKQLGQQRSSSALIFYWGVKGTFEKLDLHNILFAENYRQEFQQIFEQKTIAADPTVYIYISSKRVSSDAPDGHENWFVMVNTPENTGQDWDQLIEVTRRRILNKINRMLQIDLKDKILFEERMDPRTIETKTGSWKGSIYGNSSNRQFTAFLRHKNKTSKFKNLYFAGGSVHPGGGIPLCLASAKIVESKVREDWKL